MTIPPARGCRGFLTELIERCAQRDEDAMGRLVELLQPLVLAAVAKHFPDGPQEDLAVDAFVRVWQRAARYDGGAEGPVRWILRQVAELPEPAVVSLASEMP